MNKTNRTTQAWIITGPTSGIGRRTALELAKQCNLATVFAFTREMPHLRFNAVEPGLNPGTGLGRDANAFLQFVAKNVMSPLAPVIKNWNLKRRVL